MKLCGRHSKIIGAEPCPRAHGHRGACFWWIPFHLGGWRVTVYSGTPEERIKQAHGRFSRFPTRFDVHELLETFEHIRIRNEERRKERERCASPPPVRSMEPVPWSTPAPLPSSAASPTANPAAPLSPAERAAKLAAARARAAASALP